MKTFLLIYLTLGAALAFAAAPEPKGEGFKAYRYMRLRNIFDPTRLRDPASESAPRPTAPTTSDSGRTPFFALTGTLLRPDKVLGFFVGSSTDMNRVLGPGESIGGYKIRNVTLSGADLEKEGQTVSLPVGQQMALGGSNPGKIQAYFVPESSSSSSSSYSSPSNSPPSGRPPGPPPGSPGSMPPPSSSNNSNSYSRSDRDRDDRHKSSSNKSPEDILRKMMERAQRERSK